MDINSANQNGQKIANEQNQELQNTIPQSIIIQIHAEYQQQINLSRIDHFLKSTQTQLQKQIQKFYPELSNQSKTQIWQKYMQKGVKQNEELDLNGIKGIQMVKQESQGGQLQIFEKKLLLQKRDIKKKEENWQVKLEVNIIFGCDRKYAQLRLEDQIFLKKIQFLETIKSSFYQITLIKLYEVYKKQNIDDFLLQFSSQEQNLKEGIFQLFAVYQKHSDSIISVCFSRNGREIISGSSDGSIVVCQAKNGKSLAKLQAQQKNEDHNQNIYQYKKDIYSVDILKGQVNDSLIVIHTFIQYIETVNYMKSGEIFMTGSMDKSIKFWTRKGDLLYSIPDAHSGMVFSAQFYEFNDQILLFTASSDKTLKLWNLFEILNPRRVKRQLKNLQNYQACLNEQNLLDQEEEEFNKQLSRKKQELELAQIRQNGQLQQLQEENQESNENDDNQYNQQIQGNQNNKINKLKEGQNKLQEEIQHIIVEIEEINEELQKIKQYKKEILGQIDLFNQTHVAKNAKDFLVKSIQHHEDVIRALRISQCGRFVATASWDHTVKVYDAQSLEMVANLKGEVTQNNNKKGILTVDFSRKQMVFAGRDAKIYIYNLPSLKQYPIQWYQQI
ncbi:WD40-repeat-containing domain [Pseudocohnilembus persalinus]|uniref:WD40-repeat-containing domain n=1 Tax=Pseudocohnilembus persalinus TaxID=266149 RepID=A0A0V0QNK8_PSEPJ|nr:WD40-repeat-containing domain [Pseudocohnilembus persalinus]|eukprot:KRX03842.1 WD40-repeat-containing domain [Pseudocohnilembus persalinus]